MSSPLKNTSLALWVWIVIIVVGSVLVLGTIGFLVRFIVIRRRQADFVDTFGDENQPQRKVTVRRGRVVEQSKYLSLTGSKFGLNAFDDNDANSRGGARSKSPFEWWSTVKERSSSRNSQITQYTGDGSSIFGGPTSPGHNRIYQRRDFSYSNTSLTSTTKDEEAGISVTEVPASPPPLVRNFSRSFSRQGHSTFSPRLQTLSRIEESSPHNSMISTQQSRIQSYASNKRDTKASTSSPLTRSPNLSQQFPRPPQWPQQEEPNSKKSSIYNDAPEMPQPTLQVPHQMAYNGSRSSFGSELPRLSQASSQNSLTEPRNERQSQITALPVAPHPKQTNDYWGTRTDLHPIRSSSKKGKVLRKKSLKKAEMVTQVDS